MWPRRTSDPKALCAAAFALAAALSGCREQGTYYRCSCSFLTDYDDAAKLSIAVCSPSREQASSIGRGCAQTGAPAPVQACACEPDAARSGVTCRSGDCEMLAD
ncbi:MAG: hypothetical protein HUU21_24335 [Polyangiaceae bacterium]|nr:hypothetical protein [Polyangiaceae bacterium]